MRAILYPMLNPLRSVLLAILLGVAAAAPVAAQAVQGTLIGHVGGVGVSAVVVQLLDETGAPVAATLSNRWGHFRLRAPAAGTYRLRASRIAYTSAVSPRFAVGLGRPAVMNLRLSEQPVTLRGIEVDSNARGCFVRPDSALATARVWEEARKALQTVALAQNAELVRFDTESFRRRLDLNGRVRREDLRPQAGTTGNPYASIPAAELARHGFSRSERDSVVYYAPDAEVLLSDVFIDDHCFALQSGGAQRPHLIGLSFRPVRESDRTEIEGVLWLDRETAELRTIEYRYVQVPRVVAEGGFGGRVELQRIEQTGLWIVNAWHIRMPLLALDIANLSRAEFSAFRPRLRLVGAVEAGGVVTRVAGSGETASGETGVIRGRAIDGTTGGPLRDARVMVVGTPYGAAADGSGAFTITGVGEGVHRLSALHPRLDSLGIEFDPVMVTVERGRVAEAELAIPGSAEILGRYCTEDGVRRLGMITGRVFNPATGQPMASATLVAQWELRADLAPGSRPGDEISVHPGDPGLMWRLRARGRSFGLGSGVVLRAISTADDEGFYRLCGPPAGMAAQVAVIGWNPVPTVEELGRWQTTEIAIPDNGLIYRELFAHPAPN